MLTEKGQDLVLKHLEDAEKIAKNYYKKTPPQVQLDELISAAYYGLVDAAGRDDGIRDFKAYAAWRIIGSIKDYLRSLMWDRHNCKVKSIPESYDVAVEDDAEDFDEVLDDITQNKLTPLAKNIFRMYYGQRLPIVRIAEKVNLSGARVSQLIKANVETLRNAMCA